ncbi:MAG: hypothetical protein QOE45_2881 [Frankiaceae bacterium]|nr:hypothetical protein [Frankiaceae bacterium]
MKRTLNLRRETLSDLTVDELTSVVGGAQTAQGPTCPLLDCVLPSVSPKCSWSCPTTG